MTRGGGRGEGLEEKKEEEEEEKRKEGRREGISFTSQRVAPSQHRSLDAPQTMLDFHLTQPPPPSHHSHSLGYN